MAARLKHPIEELRAEMAEVELQSRQTVLGLPDLGYLLGGRGGGYRLDQYGHVMQDYRACQREQPVNGFILHNSTLFMVQPTTVNKVELSFPGTIEEYNVTGAQRLETGLALDDQTLILVDKNKGHIMEYNINNGTTQILVEQLNTPCDIRRDEGAGKTQYFVTEELSSQICVYDANWTPLRNFGEMGHEEGKLYYPHSTAITPDHTLLIADSWNKRICEFTLEGDFIRHIVYDLPTEPWNVSCKGRHLWVLFDNGSVSRFALYK